VEVPPTGSPVKSATFGRCPRCGRGRLFKSFLGFADRCNVCGLDFAGHDVGDGPAPLIMLVLGFVVAGGAFWFEFAAEPPVWMHVVIWPPVIVGLSLVSLRLTKGAFVGLQFKYRAVDNEFPPEQPGGTGG